MTGGKAVNMEFFGDETVSEPDDPENAIYSEPDYLEERDHVEAENALTPEPEAWAKAVVDVPTDPNPSDSKEMDALDKLKALLLANQPGAKDSKAKTPSKDSKPEKQKEPLRFEPPVTPNDLMFIADIPYVRDDCNPALWHCLHKLDNLIPWLRKRLPKQEQLEVGSGPLKAIAQIYSEHPDYVAQRFTEATGLKVRRANAIYQNEEHPLLLADFDRLIVGQKAGLECKTVSPFSADKWTDGKIPAHYMAQVNHYLAVSGFDCWYIAALIFGKELVIHKITTDKEVLNNLIAKEEHFWKYTVIPEIPPVPTGSEGDTQQINQLYSADDRNKTADLNPIRNLLDKRQELSDQIEQMEQEKTAIEQQVKLQMQDAAYGTAPGYKVSWVSSESKRVDSQRLKKEQPDIFNQYSKSVSSRRFTIIHAA